MADSRELLDSFAQPKQSFSDLFSGISQLQNEQVENKEGQADDSLFLKVIENISNDLFRDKAEIL